MPLRRSKSFSHLCVAVAWIRAIVLGLVKHRTKPYKKKNYDCAEYRGENDDPQIVIALHLRHSLQT